MDKNSRSGKTKNLLLKAVAVFLFPIFFSEIIMFAYHFQSYVTANSWRSEVIGNVLSTLAYFLLFFGIPILLIFLSKKHRFIKIYIIVLCVATFPIVLHLYLDAINVFDVGIFASV